MKYATGQEFLDEPNPMLLIAGPSGAGKSTVSGRLPVSDWFHFMVDYRIWTYYLRDDIKRMLVARAMKDPVFAMLLKADAMSMSPEIAFNNLLASSVFMGMPGDPERGGSTLVDFNERMAKYRLAEVSATLDAVSFREGISRLLGYESFVVDSSGSLCHMVDPTDPADPVGAFIEEHCLFVSITCSTQHKRALLVAAANDPKPIYYPPDFLDKELPELLTQHGVSAVEELSALDVGRYLYPRLIARRAELYQTMAAKFGYAIPMDVIGAAKTGDEVRLCIAAAIDAQAQSTGPS